MYHGYMTWNHRIVRRIYDTGDVYYAIHEVYYDEAGEPTGCTALPSVIMEDSVEDLAITLDRIRECLDKPIYDYEEDFKDV